MNKTVMWGIGAVIALVLAIGFWVSMKNSESETAVVPQAQTQDQSEKSSGTIAALVAKGATVQCTVDSATGTDSTKGTIYVSGKKVRGDFESNMPQKGPTESHMISDGDYTYVWSSAMPQGMKMKATQPATTDTKTQTAPGTDMYAKNYDYNCSPWSTDASKFELPVGMTFVDMSTMMKGVPMPTPTSGSAAVKPPPGVSCSTCDSAPAAARAQCRAALGCK